MVCVHLVAAGMKSLECLRLQVVVYGWQPRRVQDVYTSDMKLLCLAVCVWLSEMSVSFLVLFLSFILVYLQYTLQKQKLSRKPPSQCHCDIHRHLCLINPCSGVLLPVFKAQFYECGNVKLKQSVKISSKIISILALRELGNMKWANGPRPP